MKFNNDYKSRFRILKGGKISLVVSALVVGASLIGSAVNAADISIGDSTTIENVSLTENSSITVDGVLNVTDNGTSLEVSVADYDLSLTNNGTVSNSNTSSTAINIGNNESSLNLTNSTGASINATASAGDAMGIYTLNGLSNSTILNNGSILINGGNLSYGIYIGSSATRNSSITNNKNITLNGATSFSTGIITGTLEGNSSIINTTDGEINQNSTTADVYGVLTSNIVDNASIQNSGVITVITTSGYATGISANDLHTNGSIINSGSITATSTDKKVRGIQALSLYNDTSIANSGTITASSNAKAYGIYTQYLKGNASIKNTGTITSTSANEYAYGIKADGLASFSSIQNSGTFTVNSVLSKAYGIYLTYEVGADASILNQGTINVTSSGEQAYGLYFNSGMYGTITNDTDATISVTTVDNNANGIYFNDSVGVNASLVNSGTIAAKATGNGSAYGIYIHATDMYGTITNNAGGTISATTENSSANGITFDSEMVSELLENSGVIKATSTTGYSRGINLNGDMDSTIINNAGGTISATSTGDGAVGINFGYVVQGELQNSGIIEAISTADRATAISFEGYVYGTIVNEESGSISAVSNDGRAVGMYLEQGMKVDSTLSNSAIISANTVNGKAYGIAAEDYIIHDYPLENAGTIKGTINNALDKNAYSVYAPWSGAITNESTGKLYGNINVDLLINKGFVSLPHNVMGTDSAVINNLSQMGELEIGLLTDGTTTTYSQVTTNNASFSNGSTIAVNVLAASTNTGLLVGTTLNNVITADTKLTLEGTLNITDNSALLNFEYTTSLYSDINAEFINEGEGAIHLNVVKGSTISDATQSGGGDTNAQAVAGVLDQAQEGSYTNMNPVIAALNNLSTEKEVSSAVKSFIPSTAAALPGAVSQIANGIQGMVDSRQNVNLGGGLNSGEDVFSEKNVWLKSFGSLGKQKDKGGKNGFDLKAKGLGFGLDGEYEKNQKIGFAFFYAQADVDINNVSQSSNLDVFSSIVYGNVPFYDDKTNFLYQVGYAWQKTTSNRDIALMGSTATADYTTKTASLDLKVMRDYMLSNKLLLQPIVEATYRNFSSPSYTETGAGALNLQTDGFSSDEFIVGMGTLVNYSLDKNSKIIGNANIDYDVNDKQQSVTSSFQGASGVKFATQGIDNGRWNYALGIGYDREVKVGHNFNFGYNYQAQGSSFENHVFSVKYAYTF